AESIVCEVSDPSPRADPTHAGEDAGQDRTRGAGLNLGFRAGPLGRREGPPARSRHAAQSWKGGWAAQPRSVRSVLPRLDRPGQRESEGRTFVDLPLRPDPPAVSLDDALREGQADPSTLELVGTMQPLEH